MFNEQLVAVMDYINSNLSFVSFICVAVPHWISHSWFLDCCSKFCPGTVWSSSCSFSLKSLLLFLRIYCMSLKSDPQQSTCLPLLWMSQICPMLLSVIQLLVLTTLASSPQYISTIHQDEEVVSVLGNLYGHCPNSTQWCFSTILFIFFFHSKQAVPFPHMLKTKQLSCLTSKTSVVRIDSHSYTQRNFNTFFSIKFCYMTM